MFTYYFVTEVLEDAPDVVLHVDKTHFGSESKKKDRYGKVFAVNIEIYYKTHHFNLAKLLSL